MKRLFPGDSVEPMTLTDMHGQPVRLPYPEGLTHMQFRRFAGCPVCNLHLQEFFRRHGELAKAGIREVVFFQSSAEELKRHQAATPFPMIPDPHGASYRRYGVEPSWRSLADFRAWPGMIKGFLRKGAGLPASFRALFGLPADLLIDPHGRVIAAYYGKHADDQWTFEAVLGFKSANPPAPEGIMASG